MELDEADHVAEVGFPARPDVLERLLRALFYLKPIHCDEHAILPSLRTWLVALVGWVELLRNPSITVPCGDGFRQSSTHPTNYHIGGGFYFDQRRRMSRAGDIGAARRQFTSTRSFVPIMLRQNGSS